MISHDNITDFLEPKKVSDETRVKRLSVKEPRPATVKSSFVGKPKARNVVDLDKHNNEETKM